MHGLVKMHDKLCRENIFCSVSRSRLYNKIILLFYLSKMYAGNFFLLGIYNFIFSQTFYSNWRLSLFYHCWGHKHWTQLVAYFYLGTTEIKSVFNAPQNRPISGFVPDRIHRHSQDDRIVNMMACQCLTSYLCSIISQGIFKF